MQESWFFCGIDFASDVGDVSTIERHHHPRICDPPIELMEKRLVMLPWFLLTIVLTLVLGSKLCKLCMLRVAMARNRPK